MNGVLIAPPAGLLRARRPLRETKHRDVYNTIADKMRLFKNFHITFAESDAACFLWRVLCALLSAGLVCNLCNTKLNNTFLSVEVSGASETRTSSPLGAGSALQNNNGHDNNTACGGLVLVHRDVVPNLPPLSGVHLPPTPSSPRLGVGRAWSPGGEGWLGVLLG